MPHSPSEEWQEIEVTGTTAVITGLHSGSYYAYQVVGIVGEETYPSAIAVMQTEEEVPEVANVGVAPQQTSAKVSWEGHGDSFNVRYAVDKSITNTAKVTLTAGDVWGDGTGYQMLLDADANTFGSIIPDIKSLTSGGDASAEVYGEFEYKIPESADGALNTQNIVFNNSVTIEIPAGTYDWCITNPSPGDNIMYIASFHGNVGGRQDDYVFEAGMHYEFVIGLDGTYDRVDVVVTPMYGEWTQVAAGDGALTTELTGLTPSTNYVVQVQAVLANGKTTDWSPVEKFTTLDEGEIALYDDLDNQDVIDENDGKEVKATLQGRKLYKDGSWNTLCLPFTTTITSLTGDLADATLMELDTDAGNYEHVTGYENSTLYLNFKPATTIEAGKPYNIKWADTEEVIVNPVFEGVTIVGGEAGRVTSTDSGDVTFVGTYSPAEIYTTDKTNLYMAADNKLHYPWGDGMTSFKVNAFRAYFKLNNGIVCGEPDQEGTINTFVLNFGGEDATQIVSLSDNFDSPDKSDGWYTLSGMKLNGKPISKGIYINNGRKIVIK